MKIVLFIFILILIFVAGWTIGRYGRKSDGYLIIDETDQNPGAPIRWILDVHFNPEQIPHRNFLCFLVKHKRE